MEKNIISSAPLISQTIKGPQSTIFKEFLSDLAGLALISESGSIIGANALISNIFGYFEEELIGKSIDMLVVSSSRASFTKQFKSFFESPNALSPFLIRDIRGIDKADREVLFDVSLSPMQLGMNRCALVELRVQSYRQGLRNHGITLQQRLNAILKNAYQYFGLLNPDLSIVEVSTRALEFGEWKRGDVVGKKLWELKTWDPVPKKHFEEISRDLTAVSTGHFVRRYIQIEKKGVSYYFDFSLTPVLGSQGEVELILAEARDVTQERLNLLALAHKENELHMLTNAIPVGVVIFDSAERVEFANQELAEWEGLPVSEIVGQSLRELAGSASYPKLVPFVSKVMANERISFEIQKPPIRGRSKKHLEVTLVPRACNGNSVEGFYALLVDRTENRRFEIQLVREREKADSANRAKSDFLANISHEIRTPLTAISGFIQLIQSSTCSEEDTREYITRIGMNADHLSDLIGDVLDIVTVESGKLNLNASPIKLEELLLGCFECFKKRSEQKNLDFRYSLSNELPEYIYSDRTRILQLLNNVIGNAIKYTDAGYVSVDVEYEATQHMIEVIVRDTGVGISPEKHRLLFQRFLQLHEKTIAAPGTGLGLMLSKQLAHLLGGDVFLMSSSPGEGSTFVVEIPSQIPEDPANTQIDSVEVAQSHDQSKSDSRLAGKRILIAEDSPDVQEIVRLVLESVSAKVDVVGNGQEAVELALKGDYDIVLMDIQMPKMNGYQAVKLLRKKNFRRPIMALTARILSEERNRCLASGCDDCLAKPFSCEDLLSRVEHLLTSYESNPG